MYYQLDIYKESAGHKILRVSLDWTCNRDFIYLGIGSNYINPYGSTYLIL